MAQGNRKKRTEDDIEHLKEIGQSTQFGKGNDPSEAGKKGGKAKNLVNYLKQELNVELGHSFTSSSIYESIELLIMTPTSKIKELKNNDALPISLSVYANALLQDREKGRTSTVEDLLNRVYGKAKENVNVTTKMDYDEAKQRLEQLNGLRGTSTS